VTRLSIRKQLKESFLIAKFKKSHYLTKNYGTLWTRSKSTSFQLYKPSNLMADNTTIWTSCSRHYTNYIIQLKIIPLNYKFLRKYLYTNELNVFYSLVWNSKMLSIHTIICLLLVWIISPRVISKEY